MTNEHDKIFAGKNAMRRKLAALPIAEKLCILNELRARELSLRACTPIKVPADGRPIAAVAPRERER